MSRDATTMLATVLLLWTGAICVWSLWVMGPARRKPVQPHVPPVSPMPQARAKRPRLTVLRGPNGQ